MGILGNIFSSIANSIANSSSSSSKSSSSSSKSSTSSNPTYGQDSGGYYKIGTNGSKVYQTASNKQYFPNNYGGTAGWSYSSPSTGTGSSNTGWLSALTNALGDYRPLPEQPQYPVEYPTYQPIDNSALYEQMAREKTAQIRAAIGRQKTAAQGNISELQNH